MSLRKGDERARRIGITITVPEGGGSLSDFTWLNRMSEFEPEWPVLPPQSM